MRFPSVIVLLLALNACRQEPLPPAPASREIAQPASGQPAYGQPASEQPDPRPVIVAFGDSLTAGFGVDPGKSFPDFLQQELDRRGYRYRIVNAGVSGDTTSGGLARIATVIAGKPAIVILELGANDGLRGLPVASTRSNLD